MQLEKERLHSKNIEKSLHKSEAEISEKIQLVDKLQIKIKSHLATISDLQMVFYKFSSLFHPIYLLFKIESTRIRA